VGYTSPIGLVTSNTTLHINGLTALQGSIQCGGLSVYMKRQQEDPGKQENNLAAEYSID
jgi:hypothetical protein